MRNITCKNCGAKVSDQYSFCSNCGASINTGALAGLSVSNGTRQGALVGAFVGLIYGIINAVYAYFILLPAIMSALTALYIGSPEMLTLLPTLWSIVTTIVIVFVPIIGVVAGVVAGVLFVALMRRIPGNSIIRRSVAFSLILLTISVLLGLRSYFDSRLTMFDRDTLNALYSLRAGSYALILVVPASWLSLRLSARAKTKAQVDDLFVHSPTSILASTTLAPLAYTMIGLRSICCMGSFSIMIVEAA